MAVLSPKAQLFLAIQDRMKAQVAALKWIDQNFGQIDNYDQRPPVLFPCALIDLTGFTYEELPKGAQRANGRVVISLSTSPFSNSNASTPVPQKEKAIEYYEIEWAIHQALHNWTPVTGMDKLLRRTEDKQEREDPIRERLIIFECGYCDGGAVPATTQIARPEPFIGGDILLPT